MARTKKAAMRELRQEDLREKLQAQGHIKEIMRCVQFMEGIASGVCLDMRGNGRVVEGVDTAEKRLRLDAVTKKADQHWKALNKVLPDLKAVEITDHQEKTYVVSAQPLTDGEWETKYCVGSPTGASDKPH